MKPKTIAVIGASGKTGRRVYQKLLQQGLNPRGLSRTSTTPFDWVDKSTWGPALAGVDSVYVTYYPDLAIPRAESDLRDFVRLATKQGVQHLVLLSGRGEDGAQRAELEIQNSGLAWNVVRASWFMQNFSESFMADGLTDGELILPIAKAREPFIDADDIADVAVAALTRCDLRNQLFEVTGPELLTFEECVSAIASACEREIAYKSVPVGHYLAGAKASGMSEDIAWLINELFINVLDGRNERTTDTVEKVLQRPAKTFHAYLASAIQAGAWAVPAQSTPHAINAEI